MHNPVAGISADSLADFIQVAIQGGIVVAKARNESGPAWAEIEHVARYLRLLFWRSGRARSSGQEIPAV